MPHDPGVSSGYLLHPSSTELSSDATWLSDPFLSSPRPLAALAKKVKDEAQEQGDSERGLTCAVHPALLYSYLPGHIHAFYLEYVYFDRREQAREGVANTRPAPGVYSEHVQSGGHHGYGTISAPPPANA